MPKNLRRFDPPQSLVIIKTYDHPFINSVLLHLTCLFVHLPLNVHPKKRPVLCPLDGTYLPVRMKDHDMIRASHASCQICERSVDLKCCPRAENLEALQEIPSALCIVEMLPNVEVSAFRLP